MSPALHKLDVGLSEDQRELIGSTCFSHKGPRSDYLWLVKTLHCADHLTKEALGVDRVVH